MLKFKFLVKAIVISSLLLTVNIQNGSAQNDTKHLLFQIHQANQGLPYAQFTTRHSYKKIAVGEDSTQFTQTYQVIYRKNTTDSLTGYQVSVEDDKGQPLAIYNGRYLWKAEANQTLEITDAARFPTQIKLLANDFRLGALPLIINKVLQQYNNDAKQASLIITKGVTYHQQTCYQIKASDVKANGNTKAEVIYYINERSKLPAGQVVRLTKTIGSAVEIQIFDYSIEDLKAVSLPDDVFSKSKFTAHRREKWFDSSVPIEARLLLPVGSKAPDWDLPKITGGNLKLADLKGKIVVMDFWYKACAPCQQQMLDLQSLHEKFDSQKVVFVGVNTVDEPVKDKLKLFLAKRNITLPNVYLGRSITNSYNVYACPALFIIDQHGNIAYSLDGYLDKLEVQLSNQITTLLSNNIR